MIVWDTRGRNLQNDAHPLQRLQQTEASSCLHEFLCLATHRSNRYDLSSMVIDTIV